MIDKFHIKFRRQCIDDYEYSRYLLTIAQAELLEEKHKDDENYDFWTDSEAYEKGKEESDSWAAYFRLF